MKRSIASILVVLILISLHSFTASAAVNNDDYYTEFNDLTGWTKTGGIVTPNDNGVLTIYADNSNNDNRYSKINFPTKVTKNFEYECKVKVDKFSSEAGTKIEFDTHRLLLAFKKDSVYCQTKTGAITLPYDLTDRWITVRAEVTIPYVKLYIDGELATEYEMQPWTMSEPYLQFWVRHNVGDTVKMSVDYAKLTLHKFYPQLSSPAEGQKFMYKDAVSLVADILGEAGSTVKRVDYYLNDSLVGSKDTAPFKLDLSNLAPGDYTAYTIAYDEGTKSSISDSVAFTVTSSMNIKLSKPYNDITVPYNSLLSFEATATDSLSSITQVEFYDNGNMIGKAENPPYTISTNELNVGNHRIYAVAYNALGQREISETREVDVFWKNDWSLIKDGFGANINYTDAGEVMLSSRSSFKDTAFLLPKEYHYSLKGKIQFDNSAFGLKMANERHLVDISLTKLGIKYKDIKQEQFFDFPLNNGNIHLDVVSIGGYADIYINGNMLFSYSAPVTKESMLVYTMNGTDSDSFILKDTYITNVKQGEILRKDFNNTDGFTANNIYQNENGIEFSGTSYVGKKLDFNSNEYDVMFYGNISPLGEFVMNISDGDYPIKVIWKDNSIYADASAFDHTETQRTKCADVEKQGDSLWKISVSKGLIQIFQDGQWLGSFRVPKKLSEKQILFTGNDSNSNIQWLDIVKRENLFLYNDDFNNTLDEINNTFPSRTGSWSKYGESYGVSSLNQISSALVYAHGFNVDFTSDVKVTTLNSASKVYLALRWNASNYNILAGYNNQTGKWEIVQNAGDTAILAESTSQSLIPNKYYKLNVKAIGQNISLYVNDNLMVSTKNAGHISFGKVGYIVENTEAIFDNVIYSGDSRISKGTFETITKNKHTSDLLEHNGVLYSVSLDGSLIKSTDNGLTWGEREADGNLDGNILKLKNGKILSIKNRIANPNADGTYMDKAYISSDGMLTWEGPYNVEPEWKTRDTMNGKITELTSGRVVFCAGDADILESGDVEDTGGLRVYYTDDSGKTWIPSQTPITYHASGINVQEGKVIELSDGTLKLYCRTDRGFLYETTSSDSGKTWDLNLKPSQFISVLCAFNVERDPYTGWHYAVWTYENTNERNKIQHPRQRIALAVSKDDTKTFEYVMEVDDWRANTDRFMNAGLDITKDYIFANVARLNGSSNTDWQAMIYRIEKNKQVSTKYFTAPYLDAAVQHSEAKVVNNMLKGGFAFSGNSRKFYHNGDIVPIDSADINVSAKVLDNQLYIPIRTLAGALNGDLKWNRATNSITITYLNKQYEFNVNDSFIKVDGNIVNISGKIISDKDKVYVPAASVFRILGKKTYIKDTILLVSDIDFVEGDSIVSILKYINSVL